MSWSDALVAGFNRSAFGLIGRVAPARLSILMFHRVHADADTLYPQGFAAPRFDRLMALLAGSFHVLTLGQAAVALARNQLPPRALTITFDDGYADNAEVALPILQRHGLKATFFVSTGFLDGGRMWNDSIIESVRACALDRLDVTELGLGRHPLNGIAERRACIDVLLSGIKYLDLPARHAAVQQVQRLAAVKALPTDLMMRSDQVLALHRAGMEIGAHTVNHPVLTSVSIGDAERELVDGRERLQQIIDAPVDLLAYPNGRPKRDYGGSHVALVHKLGFRAAVSTAPGAARHGDDLLQLPRFTPWDASLLKWSLRLLANQRRTAFERA